MSGIAFAGWMVGILLYGINPCSLVAGVVVLVVGMLVSVHDGASLVYTVGDAAPTLVGMAGSEVVVVDGVLAIGASAASLVWIAPPSTGEVLPSKPVVELLTVHGDGTGSTT
jgi:hypothetical protein